MGKKIKNWSKGSPCNTAPPRWRCRYKQYSRTLNGASGVYCKEERERVVPRTNSSHQRSLSNSSRPETGTGNSQCLAQKARFSFLLDALEVYEPSLVNEDRTQATTSGQPRRRLAPASEGKAAPCCPETVPSPVQAYRQHSQTC